MPVDKDELKAIQKKLEDLSEAADGIHYEINQHRVDLKASEDAVRELQEGLDALAEKVEEFHKELEDAEDAEEPPKE